VRTEVAGRPDGAGSGPIRVWTIQSPSWWRTLQVRGILCGDGRRAFPFFRPAYRWLMAQMAARVPGYRGRFPVWVWQSPKPDLRHSGHLPRGEAGVRIELELARDRVLLLDFEAWHCVINRSHLSLSFREDRNWDRRTKGVDPGRAPLPEPFESELQATWARVFDFDRLRRTKLWGRVESIQGVTEYVRLDEVRRVEEFVAR
jgi:hypothetical protein